MIDNRQAVLPFIPKNGLGHRPAKRRGAAVSAAVIALAMLCGGASPLMGRQAEEPSLKGVLAERRAALAQPDEAQAIEARTTAESRSGVRRLRIGDFQYLSDSDRGYAGYDLGAGSWDTFAAILASALADEFATQAAARNLPVDSIDIVLTSRPDSPEVAKQRKVAYPRNLAYVAYIASDASEADLEALRREVERVSPILAVVRESQVIGHGPVNLSPSSAEAASDAPPGLRDFLVEKRQAILRRQRAAAAGKAGAPTGLRAHARVEPRTGLRTTRTGTLNFQILHDSPRTRAGSDLAPTVEQHLVGVLGTCMTHIFEIEAAKRQVVLDGLELRTRATLPPRTGPGNAPRFRDIAYDVHIASPEPAERIEELRGAVEASCPIYNLFKDSQGIDGRIVRGRYPADQATRPTT